MANNLNVSVLVSARNEYLKQLKNYLSPIIEEGFVSMWEDSLEESNNQPIEQFQIYLKDIKNWNQTILEDETKRIIDKCSFLMELVTAIFISYVKILGSVRLGKNENNIKIRIPTPDIFIHNVYINSGESFFYNPELFQNHEDRNNKNEIKSIIESNIEETITQMIPIKNILQEYLSNTFDDHIKKDKQEETNDKEIIDILNTQDIFPQTQQQDEPYINEVKNIPDIGSTIPNMGSDIGSTIPNANSSIPDIVPSIPDISDIGF